MSEFDPDKRGQLVHDQLNDKVIEWEPERHGRDWHRAGHQNWGNGIIEWDGLLLDGWMERPQTETRDVKPANDDDFYDDFPEVGFGPRSRAYETETVVTSGRPVSRAGAEDRMPSRDWKYWIGALIAGGLLTWLVSFGIVAGIALLALYVRFLDRRQRKVDDAGLDRSAVSLT